MYKFAGTLKKEPFNTFAMREPLQDLFDHNVPKEGENKIKTRRRIGNIKLPRRIRKIKLPHYPVMS